MMGLVLSALIDILIPECVLLSISVLPLRLIECNPLLSFVTIRLRMSTSNMDAPLNFLSLGKVRSLLIEVVDCSHITDGGGVRGVSELVILDHIMRRLQEKECLPELPKPCDYFDLMAGTSTGG
jgi:hypothetical protein